MILKDYPGHIIAGISILICMATVLWAFRAQHLKRFNLMRWILAMLTLLPMLVLLWVLWNPSRLKMTEKIRPCTVQVFFDTSQSMSIRDMYNESRLDYAVDLFKKEIAENAAESPQFQIFGFDKTCYPADSIDSLAASGKQSDLNCPWERICAQSVKTEKLFNGSQVSGAVIFTDGQADIQNLSAYTTLQNKEYPVLIVPVGSTLSQPDIIVSELDTPLQTAVNTSYAASTSIVAKQLKNKPLTVEILQNEHVIVSKTLIPNTSDYQETITFDLSAPSTGLDKIEVVAQTDALKELNTDNNRRIRLVKTIADQQRRVLLYSQVASADIGKIRQALRRDEKIQLDFRLDAIINPAIVRDNPNLAQTVEFPAEPNQLNEYDILILGPMNFNALPDSAITNLYRFVTQRGGMLVFLPGKQQYTLPEIRSEKIQSMLPVIFKYQPENIEHSFSLYPVLTTNEGKATTLISALDSVSDNRGVIPAYHNISKKPAASTLLESNDTPFLCIQRLGRGYISFLNSCTLFQLYQSDPENCFLQELLSRLIAYTSRISAEESRIDLSATVNSRQNNIVFESYVRNPNFKPVSGANVILDVGGNVIKMQPCASEGRYTATLENLTVQSVYAVAKAEYGGRFLGQKTLVLDLPRKRDEMSRTNANKRFLTDLTSHTNATLLEPYRINEKTISLFKAKQTLRQKAQSQPAWHRWPLVFLLCGLLTLNWFLRRSIGIV